MTNSTLLTVWPVCIGALSYCFTAVDVSPGPRPVLPARAGALLSVETKHLLLAYRLGQNNLPTHACSANDCYSLCGFSLLSFSYGEWCCHELQMLSDPWHIWCLFSMTCVLVIPLSHQIYNGWDPCNSYHNTTFFMVNLSHIKSIPDLQLAGLEGRMERKEERKKSFRFMTTLGRQPWNRQEWNWDAVKGAHKRTIHLAFFRAPVPVSSNI